MSKNEALRLALNALNAYMEATDSEQDKTAHDLMASAFFVAKEALTQPERKWVGLTDEETMQTWEGIIKYAAGEMRVKDFARAIEVKLKKKNT